MKSWFDWRNLRRPKGPALPAPVIPADTAITAKPARVSPKTRPFWQRFGRKPSPFELRPGAIEGWMKARPAPRPTLPGRERGDERDGIGGRK